jgi:3-isopropylmalate dehydrogenase
MRLVALPGDGIGPEITNATLDVLRAADQLLSLGLELEVHDIGLTQLATEGTTLPSKALAAARSADGVILGPVSHHELPSRAQGGLNVSGELRVALELYANIRPARSRPGMPHWGRTEMDLVVVRENLGGFYADRNMHRGLGEFMPTRDVALSIRKVSSTGCRRIATVAFELARTRRHKVTAVHKSNILELTDGLFLEETRALARQYPDVAYDELLLDSAAALLVRDAARFDVILTTNLYGGVLSAEASELSGSLGLGASLNAGDERAMAQAQHGSAPDIAGADRANPTSLILSAAMLLQWLARRHGQPKLEEASNTIERAVDTLLSDPARRTGDLGGSLGTSAYASALCAELGRMLR